MIQMKVDEFFERHPIKDMKIFDKNWGAICLNNGFVVSLFCNDNCDDGDGNLYDGCIEVCVDYFFHYDIRGKPIWDKYYNYEWEGGFETEEDVIDTFDRLLKKYKNKQDYGKIEKWAEYIAFKYKDKIDSVYLHDWKKIEESYERLFQFDEDINIKKMILNKWFELKNNEN